MTLVLALICFWISGGATLRHTDDMSDFQTFHAGRQAVGHSATAPAPIPCAACEWEQANTTLHTPTVHAVCVPWIPVQYAAALSPALHLHCFDDSAPRGPPSVLS